MRDGGSIVRVEDLKSRRGIKKKKNTHRAVLLDRGALHAKSVVDTIVDRCVSRERGCYHALTRRDREHWAIEQCSLGVTGNLMTSPCCIGKADCLLSHLGPSDASAAALTRQGRPSFSFADCIATTLAVVPVHVNSRSESSVRVKNSPTSFRLTEPIASATHGHRVFVA